MFFQTCLRMKKVSAIIPFYSGVEWLCEAVQSVLDQTYKNIEIIVVNDGSSEDIQPFLDKYQDKISYYYQENAGPAAARNHAIKHASGAYYALLDSDDIWYPQKTEIQIDFMERTGAYWSHTAFFYWNTNTDDLRSVSVSNNFDDVFRQSFLSLRIATPSVIFKKECFEEIDNLGFPENMRYGQDCALYDILSHKYPLALIDIPLIKIRLRGNNTNLRGIVRILLKSNLYCKIKDDKSGFYNRIDRFTMFILWIYFIENKILSLFKRMKISGQMLEFISKIFWAFPFVLERIYVKILVSKIDKNREYRLAGERG